MRDEDKIYHSKNRKFIDEYINPLRIESYDDLKEDMFDFLVVGAERV
jgi:hypothetical protein